jgi:predicted DNA-binding WGR domain protein
MKALILKNTLTYPMGQKKFWEIATDGKNVIVQYGRIGTDKRMVKASLKVVCSKEKRKLTLLKSWQRNTLKNKWEIFV